MSSDIYSSVAGYYDSINDGIDYGAWADFIDKIIKKHAKVDTRLVLDLACGTGKMTFALRDRGFDMTGVDVSPEMLAEASDICRREGIGDILWLCQDMTDFELYGTVDAAVCALDGINHLTKIDDVRRTLSLVHNYLVPDGLFIFDLNTPYKFENIYGANDYILEDDGVLVAWRNSYNKKTKLCRFDVTTFTETADGRYEREDSSSTERCYPLRSIKKLLAEAGFELLFISSGYNEDEPAPDAERWYIAARCKKQNNNE